MKTARFADVVKTSGTPETYLLWRPPAEDSVFQHALKENRIMTLHQELRGSKKDFGQVGFHEESSAQFIIFPKSLKRFADRRIIAIDYDLFAKDSRSGAAPVKESRASVIAPPRKRRGSTRGSADAARIFNITPASDDEATTNGARKISEVRKTADKSVAAAKASAPRKKTAAEKVVAAPLAPKVASDRAVDHRVTSVIEKTLKELRAGKSVVAYERLENLLTELRAASRSGRRGESSPSDDDH